MAVVGFASWLQHEKVKSLNAAAPAAMAPLQKENHAPSIINDFEAGGLWVGEWNTKLPGILEEDRQVPTDAARLTLATNMDERCEILKGMGVKFYKSLDEHEGGAYLGAWQTEWEGEVGPLEQTQEKVTLC
jgi:hypothetical protein